MLAAADNRSTYACKLVQSRSTSLPDSESFLLRTNRIPGRSETQLHLRRRICSFLEKQNRFAATSGRDKPLAKTKRRRSSDCCHQLSFQFFAVLIALSIDITASSILWTKFTVRIWTVPLCYSSPHSKILECIFWAGVISLPLQTGGWWSHAPSSHVKVCAPEIAYCPEHRNSIVAPCLMLSPLFQPKQQGENTELLGIG